MRVGESGDESKTQSFEDGGCQDLNALLAEDLEKALGWALRLALALA